MYYDVLFFHFSGFTNDPDTSPFEIRGHIPQLSILADYKITGSVLILPIVGEGRLNITMGIIMKRLRRAHKSIYLSVGLYIYNFPKSCVQIICPLH